MLWGMGACPFKENAMVPGRGNLIGYLYGKGSMVCTILPYQEK